MKLQLSIKAKGLKTSFCSYYSSVFPLLTDLIFFYFYFYSQSKLQMKKVVLKLDFHDNKCRQKVMKTASGIPGVDSVSLDKEQKLTVTGEIDPVVAARKLGKLCRTEIVSVGPAKEPEKKKEEPKKQEPKKPAEPKKDPLKEPIPYPPYTVIYHPPMPTYYPPLPEYHIYGKCVEENPPACVIC